MESEHVYFLSERVLSEARYELPRRVQRMRAHGLPAEPTGRLLQAGLAFPEIQTTVIATNLLRPHKQEARLRIPRDPNDWELVAVALLIGADIWTSDANFLGCGLAT